MRGLIQTQGLLHRSPGNAHGPGSAADRRVLSVYPQGSQDPLPCQGQWAPGFPVVPLVAAVVAPGPGYRDVGVYLRGVHAGLDELAALDVGVASGMAGLLVPAGADVAVGGH